MPIHAGDNSDECHEVFVRAKVGLPLVFFLERTTFSQSFAPYSAVTNKFKTPIARQLRQSM